MVDITEKNYRGRGPGIRILEVILGKPQFLTILRESTKPGYEA
jgi:hypothetical protein